MLTRIDHVMICVPDLQRGIDAYTRIGFNVYPGGVHTGRGTHNAIAFLQDDYLELMSVRDPAEHRAAASGVSGPDSGLLDFLARGGGFRYVIVQSDDLASDVAGMRRRGVDVTDPADGGRQTPSGQTLRWKTATLGPQNPLPLIFIQHLTPVEERRRQVPRAGDHPNGALRADRVYIAVPDVAAAAPRPTVACSACRLLRSSAATSSRRTWRCSTWARPDSRWRSLRNPDPPRKRSRAWVPGPFQVLYRTSSMDAAARFMADHGVPPPARGIRNTGEQAMLVGPDNACGAYIGFVGPA